MSEAYDELRWIWPPRCTPAVVLEPTSEEILSPPADTPSLAGVGVGELEAGKRSIALCLRHESGIGYGAILPLANARRFHELLGAAIFVAEQSAAETPQ